MIFRLLIYSCLQLLNLHGYGEYLRLIKRWVLRHGYILFHRQLIDDSRGIFSDSVRDRGLFNASIDMQRIHLFNILADGLVKVDHRNFLDRLRSDLYRDGR